LFLGGFDLTPTFRDVNKKYSTRYYLSLVLIDEGRLNSIYPCIIPTIVHERPHAGDEETQRPSKCMPGKTAITDGN
jgi:hypothetical protein